MKGRQEDWKNIVEKFRKTCNYDSAYKELVSGDWLKSYSVSKTRAQTSLREHVSGMCLCLVKCISQLQE